MLVGKKELKITLADFDYALDLQSVIGNTIVKNQIKLLNRQARLATTIQEQHNQQEQIRKMERKKRAPRQKIFDVEDEISEKRDRLIDALEKRMQQKTKFTPLFTIQWSVV